MEFVCFTKGVGPNGGTSGRVRIIAVFDVASDRAVAANRAAATGSARVAVVEIAVVALFSAFLDVISAEGLEQAQPATPDARGGVAVVALFGGVLDGVAAALGRTVRAAAVPAGLVAVIALLAALDD